jgi:hypothetical protein
MTLIEYNNLSISQRLDLAWEWAYFVCKNTIGNRMTVIFFMDGFFVEICLGIYDNKTELVMGITKEEFEQRFVSTNKNRHFFEKNTLIRT